MKSLTELVVKVVDNVLRKFKLRINIAAKQHCDTNHKGLFSNLSFGLIRDNSAKKLDQPHWVKHILCVDNKFFVTNPVVCIPLSCWSSGYCLVLRFYDLPNDFQRLGPQLVGDVRGDVGWLDKRPNVISLLNRVCALELLLCVLLDVDDLFNEVFKFLIWIWHYHRVTSCSLQVEF